MIEFDPVLVHEWLTRSARRHPEKEALVFENRRLTYRTLDRHSDVLAHALADAGIRRHDAVVILLNNSPELVIAVYGILKAGAVFIPLDGSVKAGKLSYILKDCGARALIADVRKAGIVSNALKQAGAEIRVIWVGDMDKIPMDQKRQSFSWSGLLADADRRGTDALKSNSGTLPRVIDVDLAALIYTSGSTGQPKGVMSTHHNMISAARSIIQYVGNSPDDIILDVLPLSFDYGLYQVIMAFMFGGTVVLENSFLYLHRILERIAGEKITGFPVVPTIAAMLLQRRDLSRYDFSSLRYMTNTAAYLPVNHIRRLRHLFPHVRIYSMYGLTECKRVAYLPPEKLDEKPASVGWAMPNCETFVMDENGNVAAPGETGELVIRGSNVMQGYFNDPDATGRTYQSGPYPAGRLLRSGDYFKTDREGCLYFLGRRDDMIKSRGERISAREVENTLCSMDGVSEAAVIGVPDEVLGQSIRAYVVAVNGVDLDSRDVLQFCKNNLESFAVPKFIVICLHLPKSANGKIDKKRLTAKNLDN